MRMTDPHVSRAKGFTLRELSIAMAIGSVVMMTAVNLIHDVFDWTTLARHRRMDDQTFFRFSSDFRKDVHLADRIRANGEEPSAGDDSTPAGVTIVLGDETVVDYSMVENAVVREESDEGTVVRRERYRFKIPREVSIHPLDDDKQWQLDIRTVLAANRAAPPWRLIRVSAGLRLRHERAEVER